MQRLSPAMVEPKSWIILEAQNFHCLSSNKLSYLCLIHPMSELSNNHSFLGKFPLGVTTKRLLRLKNKDYLLRTFNSLRRLYLRNSHLHLNFICGWSDYLTNLFTHTSDWNLILHHSLKSWFDILRVLRKKPSGQTHFFAGFSTSEY